MYSKTEIWREREEWEADPERSLKWGHGQERGTARTKTKSARLCLSSVAFVNGCYYEPVLGEQAHVCQRRLALSPTFRIENGCPTAVNGLSQVEHPLEQSMAGP